MIEKLTSPSEVVGQRVRRTIGVLACTFITSAGGALAMNNIGQTEATIGPTVTDVGLRISGDPSNKFGLGGGTDFGLSDMGAHFETHTVGPSINGSIKSINFSRVKSAVGPTVTTGQLEKSLGEEIATDIDQLEKRKFEIAARSIGAFGLGATGTAMLLESIIWSSQSKNRRRMREIARSNASIGLAGALTLSVGGSVVAGATFDPSQFTAPQKSGAVASAEVLGRSSNKVRLSDERNANNAVAVLSLINSIEAEAKREEGIKDPVFRVIVIGDNHRVNPDGLVAGELQQSDTPATLFDTGDHTDFGLSQENNLVEQWYTKLSGIDKYTVPGNHDSDATVEALRKAPNTVVVEKGEIKSFTVDGLRVLAVGDPLYTPEHSATLTDSEEETLATLRTRITEEIALAVERDEPYDIIFTHEPGLLDDIDLAGANVIDGHTHHQETTFDDESWHVNPGTTGGAGLRRLQGVTQDSDNEATPRSYTVLYFDQSCQLIEAKEVSYDATGADDEYSVKKIANPDYDPEDASTRCAP